MNENTIHDKPFKYTLLTRKEVEAITKMARSTIYDAMKNSDFPIPIRKGCGKGVVWLQHELEEWVEKRMANRPSVDEVIEHA